MIRLNTLYLLFPVLIFTACGKGSQEPQKAAEKATGSGGTHKRASANNEQAGNEKKQSVEQVKKQPEIQDRKLIKEADVKFKVSDVDSVTREIEKLMDHYPAYIGKMNLTSGKRKISNEITIRVKSGKFDSFLKELMGNAVYLDYKRINTKDVTEDFIDLKSRLETKKAFKKKYEEILKKRSDKVKELLKVQEKIREIQEEIEAKEGRLRYLRNKVGYSTINLEIYEEVDYKPDPRVYNKSFLDKAKESFKNGWEFIKGFVLVLINIWPLFIVLIIVLVWWKRDALKKLAGRK